MLLFYALEARSAAFVLAFAGACLASSAYGFLQGAWPFGAVELIWSGIAAAVAGPADVSIVDQVARRAGGRPLPRILARTDRAQTQR